MKLVVLYGKPAVGKLTVARELADLTGYKLFHNHLTVDLVSSVFEFGSEPFVELRESIWLSVISRAVEAATPGLIFTFAPENTVRQCFIRDLVNVVESREGEVLFVELTCDDAELERRMADPSRHKFNKLRSPGLFRELDATGVFSEPRLPAPLLVVDTGRSDPREAALSIRERLALDTESDSQIGEDKGA